MPSSIRRPAGIIVPTKPPQLVTEADANSLEGKIAVTTPIAKGLMGKKVGEVAKVQVPAGLLELEVLEISI